jgi:hypothetical protein
MIENTNKDDKYGSGREPKLKNENTERLDVDKWVNGR